MKIYWFSSSRVHNWVENENKIVREIIDESKSINLFKDIQWMYEGFDEKKKKKLESDFDIKSYIKEIRRKNSSFSFSLGSFKPFDWEANFLLSPYISSANQVRGFNSFNFYFEDDFFMTNAGSDFLAEVFKKISYQDNSDFAAIHPYVEWHQLTDVIKGEYQNPLTISSLFAGVYWMFFIGKEQLSFFDTKKLKDLDCYEFEWISDGLFVRMSRNIGDALKPDLKAQMFHLTDIFRKALI